MAKWVKCSIIFYYSEETYIQEDDETPSDEEIFKRCKEYMIDDIYDSFNNPLYPEAIKTEFEEPPWIDDWNNLAKLLYEE